MYNLWNNSYEKNYIAKTILKFRDFNHNDFHNKKFLSFLALICTSLWLLTGFFSIEADQQGVILRFGQFVRQVGPGLNYKLPEPIETVEKVSVTRIKKDVIGQIYHHIRERGNASDMIYPKESQMLTGDENIIDMNFFVQWRIDNATNYLFSIKDSYKDLIVKTAVESVMRQVISGVNISEALSERRLIIETSVQNELQNVLSAYGSGIEIISVGILYSYVAPEVRDSYRDVQSAKADREKYINHAQAYRNEVIPKAKGEARAIIERALAIKNSNITRAEGEAKKFNKIHDAYTISKNITRKRMYLDTMNKVYADTTKIIIDDNMANNILPLLNLNKINE